MSAEKDINRIRELIIGEDIKRFEKKFDVIETQLNDINSKQKLLLKKIKKQRKKMNVNNLEVKNLDNTIQSSIHKSSEQLKKFKTEFIMHIESKLNHIDEVNISKKQLAKIFETLSFELEDKLDTKKYAK